MDVRIVHYQWLDKYTNTTHLMELEKQLCYFFALGKYMNRTLLIHL